MLKKIITTGWLLMIAVLVFHGCSMDTTVVIPLHSVDVTSAVSFKNDLIPILTKNCALGGCHASGGHKPDLTPARAYNSLINGSFISLDTPENSVLYQRLTGKLSPAMPIGGAPNPSNIEGLLLAWIQQGAENN